MVISNIGKMGRRNEMLERLFGRNGTIRVISPVSPTYPLTSEFEDLSRSVSRGMKRLHEDTGYKLLREDSPLRRDETTSDQKTGFYRKRAILKNETFLQREVEDFFNLADEVTEELQSYNHNGSNEQYNGGKNEK